MSTDTDTGADIIYQCPACGSYDVRIDATINVIYRPNDPEETIDDLDPIGFDAMWEDDSLAMCADCRWQDTAAQLSTAAITTKEN